MAQSNDKETFALMKKIACVGILVADVIVRPVDEYPERGALSRVDAITVHSGGNAMTASINLRKMGVESKIIGKVVHIIYRSYRSLARRTVLRHARNK